MSDDKREPSEQATPGRLLQRAMGAFTSAAGALDTVKAQCVQAARQQALMNRRAALLDQLTAKLSALLQTMAKPPERWPEDLEAQLDALEQAMVDGPTNAEDQELLKLQEEVRRGPVGAGSG